MLARPSAHRPGLAPLAEPMASMWFTDTFRRRSPRVVRGVRERILGSDPEGYARTCEALAKADTTSMLERITAPTLIACGMQDAPAFVEAAPVLADAIPDTRLVWLEGGKHAAASSSRRRSRPPSDFVGEPSLR